jgi:hypothetical protein
MRIALLVALALIAVGLVWIGQGLGLLRGSSFMVDDLRWAIAGLIAVVVGIIIGLRDRRNRPPSTP